MGGSEHDLIEPAFTELTVPVAARRRLIIGRPSSQGDRRRRGDARRHQDGCARPLPPPVPIRWLAVLAFVRLLSLIGSTRPVDETRRHDRHRFLQPCRHQDARGRTDAPLRFSIADGRLVCPACAPTGNTVALPHDLVEIMRRWQQASHFREIAELALPLQQGLGFRRFLGIFMGFHLEDSLRARQLAWQLLEARGTTV